MSGAKLFIAALALLVVIFAIGVGFGARNSRQQLVSTKGGWPETIKNLLIGDQQLLLAEFTPAPGSASSCLQENMLVVPQLQPCSFLIRPTDDPIRTLKLHLVAGASAEMVLEQASALDAEGTIAFDEMLELDIYKQTAPEPPIRLTIVCNGGCRFEVP